MRGRNFTSLVTYIQPLPVQFLGKDCLELSYGSGTDQGREVPSLSSGKAHTCCLCD